MRRVVPAVYRREKAEGTFRYDHAWLRTHSESVAFCGVEAVEGRERERLDGSFDAVVDARQDTHPVLCTTPYSDVFVVMICTLC